MAENASATAPPSNGDDLQNQDAEITPPTQAEEVTMTSDASLDPPEPPPVVERRFLLGQETSAGFHPGFPRWFKILLACTAASVSLFAFFSVVSWPLSHVAQKPWLSCVVETEYLVPAVPPIAMARQDARLVQSTIGISMRGSQSPAVSESAKDNTELKRFFEHQLQNLESETCVLYVAAHGISDEQTGYLLHGDSHPGKPESGYTIRKLLDSLVRCPAKNKLLVLDACRIDHSLRLGMLGNDFIFHLKREFAELKDRMAADSQSRKQNIWILCACDDGQVSCTSPALGVSPFALAVTYGLRGGSLVDQPQKLTNKRDGRASTAELGDYVAQSVSSWALKHHNMIQTPFMLSIGEDFPLAMVNNSMTESDLWKEFRGGETSPAAPDPAKSEQSPPDASAVAGADTPPKTETGNTVKKDDAKSPKAGKTADAASGKAEGAPAAQSEPDLETLISRVGAYWSQGEKLLAVQGVLARPLQWSRFQQSLFRAEEALFSDEKEQAEKILDHELPKRLSSFKRQAHSANSPNWSLAYQDDNNPDLAAQKLLILKVLEDPSDKNLVLLQKSEMIEAGLILSLARECRINEHWSDVRLIKLAVDTRTRGEVVTLHEYPYVLPFIRSKVESGDELRRRAEIALVTGHLDRAEQGLRAARVLYEQAGTEAETAAAQLTRTQHMAVNLPNVIEWIGGDNDWTGRKLHDLGLFGDFVRGLDEFCHKPSAEALSALAKTADDLQRRGGRYAEDALQPTEWVRNRAALKLPFLKPVLRERLLHNLLTKPANPQFKIDFRNHVSVGPRRPATPYPLGGVFALLLDNQDHNTGLQTLISQLDAVGPAQDDQPIMWRKMAGDDKLRLARAKAAGGIRRYFDRLRNRPIGEINRGNWWQRWVRLLLLSDWRAVRFLDDDARDIVMRDQIEEVRLNHLRWAVGRLYADSMELPGFCYGRAIEVVSKNIRMREPEFRTPTQADSFALVGDSQIPLASGESSVVPLTLKALRGLSADDAPTLILERTRGGDSFRFALDGVEDVKGRLSILLEAPFVAHEERQAWLKVSSLPQLNSTEIPELSVRVEMKSGQVDWLPISLKFLPPAVKPAELVLAWDDSQSLNGRIDIFPNQAVPLNLSVRKNVAGALNVRLEFLTAGEPHNVSLALTAKQSGEIPVVFPQDLALPLDQTMLIRLFQEKTLLDEREIEVALLDVRRAFRRQIRYDPQASKVTARITRIRNSDSPDPIPFQLQLQPHPASNGRLATELPATEDNLRLDARVPPTDYGRCQAVLAVAGVPRIFRDDVGLSSLAGRANTKLSLSLTHPSPLTKLRYAPSGLIVPVTAQVDGPEKIRYEIGLDFNHNGKLDGFERQQGKTYWNGRSAEVRLVAVKKPPALRIETSVSDITLDVDVSGAGGRQTIIARAIAGSKTQTVQLPVFVLQGVPSIRVTSPGFGATVPWNEPVTVFLEGDSETAAAIDRVEFGFDKNDNGAFDDGEAIVPLGVAKLKSIRFVDTNRLKVQLPTKGLPPGPVSIMARAAVDVLSPEAAKLPSQSPPAGPAGQGAGAPSPSAPASTMSGSVVLHEIFLITTGSLSGQVVTPDGLPRKGALVTVNGLGRKVSGAMGEFSFQGVPAGTYKIVAQTSQRIGAGTVVVKPGRIANLEIKIAVQ